MLLLLLFALFLSPPRINSSSTLKISERTVDELISISCDWVRDYLNNNRYVDEGDRHLCDGIGILPKSLLHDHAIRLAP